MEKAKRDSEMEKLKRESEQQDAKLSAFLQLGSAHAILLAYTALALFPVALIIINSFKTRRAIFGDPYSLPNADTFSFVGYETLADRGNFEWYFLNSAIVTLVSMFLILWFGSMAAFALSEYKFKGNTALGLFMSIGIMVPIRLGTVSLLRLMVSLGLINNLLGLILVYTASGLPLAIFILSGFMKQVPTDLKNAARVDGASEYHIYTMILPLVRPAVGTVAVFNIIPIWNDLWFPLILAPSEAVKTVTLGTQSFLGQFLSDWNAVLSALTISAVPVVILYIIFSRQLIKGLTSGSIK
jgi:raffinose/stachyose/melibiose transport system permease protein